MAAARPVVMVLPFPSLSGLELFGLRFAQDLQSRGNPVAIACPRNGAIWNRALELELPRTPLAPFLKFNPVGITTLCRFFRSEFPRALVTFRTQTAYSVHAAKLLTRSHAPQILFYRLGAGNYHRRDPIHRKLFQHIAAVVPNAEHVERKIRQFWAIAPEKVHCIKSGVDTRKYRPDPERRALFRRENGIPEQAIVIGNTGRIHPEKGSLILLEALFGNEGPGVVNPAIHLVYVGREYAPGYADSLRSRAAELGVQSRFHLLPFRSDIEEVYPGFDFFSLAVTSHETYAYVALEAMASGVVPIVPLVGGMKEMFVHGQEGFFFPHRDAAALRATLQQCLNLDAQAVAAMGVAARKRIEETASWNTMMERYLSLFSAAKVVLNT